MSSTATSTQINVRIDRQLKEAGDAALTSAGITPSQAIRMLWERAVELRDDPLTLPTALFPSASSDTGSSSDVESRREKLTALALEGQTICARARSEAGIAASAAPIEEKASSDAELYTEELYERYAGRWSL